MYPGSSTDSWAYDGLRRALDRTLGTGRGTRINADQRRQARRVFSAYRDRLDEENKVEFADTVREARLRLSKRQRPLYRAVVADEVQDLRQTDLSFLRALAPAGQNDLFLAGDPTGPRNRAMAVLEGLEIDDLDEGHDTSRGYHSLRTGKPPQLVHVRTAEQQQACIVERIRGWLENGAAPCDICVTARSKKWIDLYRAAVKHADIPTVEIRKDADPPDRTNVRFATMHRVKGLVFRYILIAGVQEGVVPLKLGRARMADRAAREAHENGERHLLYVAATRPGRAGGHRPR
ncbi:MAG: UvrD-helicase domain-containing protein [Myxococcales bacterium]|nr:UvrD-helicase domain-containing protein [Myxococcales bacterium]